MHCLGAWNSPKRGRDIRRPWSSTRHLLETLRISADYADAHDALAQICMESRQFDRALRHSQAAVLLDPKDIDYAITRGAVLTADNQTTAAWDVIKPLLDAGARHPRLAMLYARLASQFGHERQALAEVDWAFRSGVPRNMAPRLHFDAASLLDRMGRYDEAFAHARRANELLAKPCDASALVDADRKIAYFTPQRLRCLPRSTVDSRRIILIVGMPRSGTTLVEQILASHPQVFGGGESHVLDNLYQELCQANWSDGAEFPESLDSLSLSSADRLAKRYQSELVPPEAGSAVYITDKTPLNFRHLGLVELLLPNCHVIHCTRSPLDTCLSCYFTDFAFGHDFSRDLEQLGAMFRHYQRLMAHWNQFLTIPIHQVRYEDLVLDLETQSRRITGFLQLPWDKRCLKFHENPRRVYTASKHQVRQPIYLSSIGRWRNYQRHIAKLIDALATA
jgi:tetratricopeptide (TPR) repeat protein